MQTDQAGWAHGEFRLPPDEAAELRIALDLTRDAEFRDRNNLPADAAVRDSDNATVTLADAFVRLTREGLDGLDATLSRTGRRGERTKVVLHHDIDPQGRFGPAQLHNGAVIPDVLARYLSCDAEVLAATYAAGRLVGIHPAERTVNRQLRRLIERRDQGCTHPLCNQRRFVHIHHIEHWEHGGRTIPANLVSLCQRHHRQLHHGDFTIEGDPEAHTLRFFDSRGAPIEPPALGSPRPPRPPEPNPYTQPFGERLQPRWFTWN